MNELLAAFLAAVGGIKDQANAMLAGLPPLEQYEATSEISYGIRSLQRYGAELVANAENLSKQMAGITESIQKKCAATAETDLLAGGLYVLKTDADAALTAALQTRETEVRTAFDAELKAKAAIADKRTKLVTDKVLPAIAAEKLSDEVLGGAGAEAAVQAVNDRLTKLKALGLTEANASKSVATAASLPFDETGNAAFDTHLGFIREGIEAGKGKPAPVNPLAAGTGAGTGGGDAATRVSRLI